LDSWCNYESLNELSEVIDKATITHHPNTFETMENIMPTVKQMYKTIHNAPPIAAPCRENEVVDKNEQCKIYHPHLDRNYSDEPTQFICTILQVFNAPLYKKLVGYELYEPEAIQTFIDAQPLNKNAITKFASHFTGVYYRVNLSEIVAFCKLLGFQYVNVYEFACRPLWHPKTGVFTNKKIENKVNMIESNTRKRKSMLLGGVKCKFGSRRNRNTGICETYGRVVNKSIRKMRGLTNVIQPTSSNVGWLIRRVLNGDTTLGNPAIWDMSRVTSMADLFYNVDIIPFDISGWDVSRVVDMSFMFMNSTGFNQDISGWNVGRVTNMTHMFRKAISFNQDIGMWDVSRVTDMQNMFKKATSFNQDIGRWNVGRVTDMTFMFAKATSFNQNLTEWKTKSLVDNTGMFDDAISFDVKHNWATHIDVARVDNSEEMQLETATRVPDTSPNDGVRLTADEIQIAAATPLYDDPYQQGSRITHSINVGERIRKHLGGNQTRKKRLAMLHQL
jgi:surface protein